MRLSAACSQINRSAVTTLHLNASSIPSALQSRPLTEFEHTLLSWKQAPSRSIVCSGCGRRHHGAATKFCAGFKCTHGSLGAGCGAILATCPALVYDIADVLSSRTQDGGKHIVQEVCQFAATAPATYTRCAAGHESVSKPTLLCTGFSCPNCQRFCVISSSVCFLASIGADQPTAIPPPGDVTGLQGVQHDGDNMGMGIESMHALYMMGGAAAGMLELKHLGVHRLPLTFQAISALGQLLSCLACNLVRLTVSIQDDQAGAVFSVHEKVLFFKAVARVLSLQELVMPQWEAVVGEEAADCVEALYWMPELRVVYVTEVKESPAFPPGLTFESIHSTDSGEEQDAGSQGVSL
jgi:hypothetical protein